MRFTRSFSIGFILTLASAQACLAFRIIDDFETGYVNLSATTDTVEATLLNQGGGGHTVWPYRHFELMPNPNAGGALTAQVTPWGAANDYLRVMSTSGYGAVSIEWNWGTPQDLTEGGAVDSLQLQFTVLPQAGGSILVTIGDANGITGVGQGVAETGLFRIGIADWPLVDVTAATRLSIQFNFLSGEDNAIYRLADIRTVGAGAATPNFTGEWMALSSSPLPSAPCVFRSELPIGNPLYKTEIGFYDIQTGPNTPVLNGEWDDRPHFDGEMCLIRLATVPGGRFLYDWVGIYEFFIDLTPAGAPAVEIAYPPDPIRGMRSVGVPLMITTRDGMGTPIGASNAMLFIDVVGTQPILFNDAYVIPTFGLGGGITGLRVGIDVGLEELINDAASVFEISWQSDYTEVSPVSVAGAALPAAPGERLIAAPSLTRASTELRAAIPFAPDTRVQVHDCSGRLIRELRPAVGATTIAWDGAEQGGGRAAAGVYFARRSDRPGASAARITLVR